MRALACSAVVLLLAAAPAEAGDPRGGGHNPPPPGPCCAHPGGPVNVNVNVNASARAGASARSFLNARAYAAGTIRSGGHGGTFYVGGGYYGGYGDAGWGGVPVYHELDPRDLACASAPFGYVVTGFGRDGRRPPACAHEADDAYAREDRGGRYGYSERHVRREERSYEHREFREDYRGDEGWTEEVRDRCGCDRREPAPYPPAYLPEPPRYEPPPPSYPRPYEPLPRHEYRQEPGERG